MIHFLVYGQSRSGSTLLQELLDSHEDVCCEGEILCSDWGYVRNSLLLRFLKCYPDFYLKRRTRLAKASAYGCKLMFYHLYCPEYGVKRLQAKGWNIIHIRRSDKIRQCLSTLLAKKTGHWHRREGVINPDYQVTIDEQEFVQALHKRVSWQKREDRIVASLPHLRVTYEKDLLLSDYWQATADKICRFLHIKSAPVTCGTKTTDLRSYAEIITNYNSLLTVLQQTPYSHLLRCHRN